METNHNAPGITHLSLDMRDIAPPRMLIAHATRMTIDLIGARAAMFDLVSTLLGGLTAVAKQGDEFTISLGSDIEIKIKTQFPGVDLRRAAVQDMIRELTTEPETTEEEAKQAFIDSASALVHETARRNGHDPIEVANEIMAEVERDQLKRKQHLN